MFSLRQRFGLLVGDVFRVGNICVRSLVLERGLILRFGQTGWRSERSGLPAIPAAVGFDRRAWAVNTGRHWNDRLRGMAFWWFFRVGAMFGDS